MFINEISNQEAAGGAQAKRGAAGLELERMFLMQSQAPPLTEQPDQTLPCVCSDVSIHKMDVTLAWTEIGGLRAERSFMQKHFGFLGGKVPLKSRALSPLPIDCCSSVDLPKWPWGRIWCCWGTLTTQLSAGKAI